MNWTDLELTVGVGKNQFSMKKGSFQYKKKYAWKAKTRCFDKNDMGTQGEQIFQEEKYKSSYWMEWEEKERGIDLSLVPDQRAKELGVNRFWLRFRIGEGEHFYGCGETHSEFDLKGENVRIWVAEHQNSSRISKKVWKESLFGKHPEKKLPFHQYESYYAQPTFVSSKKYFLHLDTNQYCEFDFREDGYLTIYCQEAAKIHIETASSFEELSFRLSNYLGRQGYLPDWVYDGAILASQDWKKEGENLLEAFDGCNRIEKKIESLEKRGAKVSGVWSQDWCGCRCTTFGYQVMWNWEYSREKYPNLPEKIAKWKKRGIHFLGYITPFLALEKGLYQEAHAKGYCVKNEKGEDYLVTITTFPAAMVDFTNPEAYAWYKELIKKNLIGIGMSGWMADFGEYLPQDAVLQKGSAEEFHNQWPAIWAKLNREAIEEAGKEKEVFFFTRAGHTNTVRYSNMMWTGDQHVDWSIDDGLPSVLPASLSLSMSGFGLSHSDVGGYTTIGQMRRSKELLMRWEELNLFSPLFRFHEGNRPGENVQFDEDEELLDHLANLLAMRKKLVPYLKNLVAENAKRGIPIMRPIFYHYEEDWAYLEKTAFLLGRDLYVAPVLEEGKRSRTVHLPKDQWIHLFTKEEYEGGVYEIGAELGKPAAFVRKESFYREDLLKIGEE